MKTKSLLTQYQAGSRSPECVLAYRDYHREYERARSRREHQRGARETAIADAFAETIELTRQEIIAEVRG